MTALRRISRNAAQHAVGEDAAAQAATAFEPLAGAAAELEEVVITDPRSGFTRLPVKAASAMLKT